MLTRDCCRYFEYRIESNTVTWSPFLAAVAFRVTAAASKSTASETVFCTVNLTNMARNDESGLLYSLRPIPFGCLHRRHSPLMVLVGAAHNQM